MMRNNFSLQEPCFLDPIMTPSSLSLFFFFGRGGVVREGRGCRQGFSLFIFYFPPVYRTEMYVWVNMLPHIISIPFLTLCIIVTLHFCNEITVFN